MHGSLAFNRTLFDAISQTASLSDGEVMIFAPTVYLDSLLNRGQELKSSVVIGAQNLSQYEQGAYTGEVSAAMLKDIGCSHVLVGHSERRSLYHESNSEVAEKFAAALKHDLVPVLCIGESLEQREAGQTLKVVFEQIDAVGELVGFDAVCNAIVAYEPVWAIGTGKTASPDQAQEVHQEIRAHLREKVGELVAGTRILYGGSVNDTNANELFAMEDIDGGLVGGAALKADSFSAICKAAG